MWNMLNKRPVNDYRPLVYGLKLFVGQRQFAGQAYEGGGKAIAQKGLYPSRFNHKVAEGVREQAIHHKYRQRHQHENGA